MHIKHKSKYMILTVLFSTLILAATFSLSINFSETKTENIVDNIIGPKESATGVQVEFVQEEGHNFIYNDVDSSGNFLKTGDGAFTVKIHSDADPYEQFQLVVQGKDNHYNTSLCMDLKIIEDPLLQDPFFPFALTEYLGFTEGGFWYEAGLIAAQVAINILGIEMDAETSSIYDVLKFYELNVLRIVLSPQSVNYEETTYYSTYNSLEACHEIVIPDIENYFFDPRIYLGYSDDNDITDMLKILPLLSLDVFKKVYIQDIKYDLTNIFTLSLYDGGVVAGGIDGQTEKILIVRNDDITAPKIEVEPVSYQENPNTNWEVKLKIVDEPHGSGLNNESVILHYSVNQGPWKEADKMHSYGDGYHYTEIPNQFAGSEIQYYIEYKDMKGNSFTSEIYTFYANPLEIQPIAILLIGIAVATIATIAATRIYRNRHQPRVITLPTKKKVDKYYKKVKKEGGNV